MFLACANIGLSTDFGAVSVFSFFLTFFNLFKTFFSTLESLTTSGFQGINYDRLTANYDNMQ